MQSVAAVGGHSSALHSSVNSCGGTSTLQPGSRLHSPARCTTSYGGNPVGSSKSDELQILRTGSAGARKLILVSPIIVCKARTKWARMGGVHAAGKTASVGEQSDVVTSRKGSQFGERRFPGDDVTGKCSGSGAYLTPSKTMPQQHSRHREKCQRRQERSGSRGAARCTRCARTQSAEPSLMSADSSVTSASSEYRQRVAKFLSCCAAMLVTGSPLLPAQALTMPSIEGGTANPSLYQQTTPLEANAYSITAPPLTKDNVFSYLTTGNETPSAIANSSLHSLPSDSQASTQVRVLVSSRLGNLVGSLGDSDQAVELVNPPETNLDLPESKDVPKGNEKKAESKKPGLAIEQKVVKNPVENSPDLNPEVNANLVLEAWNVVDQVYLDARGKGFDREAWAAKRDDALKHPIRSRIAAYAAIKGLMGSLNDPYTRFITPDQFQALSKFDVSGIGLNMGEVDDDDGVTSLRVLGVVHDSSAHAAGIRQNDALLSVGGLSVKGKSAFEATSLIQGPVGQPVTLELQRPTGEVFQAIVPRGKEAQQPVSYKLQKDAEGRPAGYVKLRDFSALAKKGVVEAVQRLGEAGAQSFILDLQDNLGGLVQAGIEIARLFLDEGETVVYTVGRTPETQKNVLAQGPAVFSAPLIVLVNESTASASEIVAGALHDNCRALLVGNKTYGKGLIQSVYELTDGSALAITVGKYITPGHIDIDKYGIEPDFVRTPGPFNMFVPLPSVKEINAKLQSCTPPKIERGKPPTLKSLARSQAVVN